MAAEGGMALASPQDDEGELRAGRGVGCGLGAAGAALARSAAADRRGRPSGAHAAGAERRPKDSAHGRSVKLPANILHTRLGAAVSG